MSSDVVVSQFLSFDCARGRVAASLCVCVFDFRPRFKLGFLIRKQLLIPKNAM